MRGHSVGRRNVPNEEDVIPVNAVNQGKKSHSIIRPENFQKTTRDVSNMFGQRNQKNNTAFSEIPIGPIS
jgi:hypothetical protein